MDYKQELQEALNTLGIKDLNPATYSGIHTLSGQGELIESFSPADGQLIGKVHSTTKDDYEAVMLKAQAAFEQWRITPAPQRGEIVRQIGNKLREHKRHLGMIVSYEMGKVLEEGLGEVQEMIDICDFAVGLSRQLHGLTIKSERPNHRMMEQWHPAGIVGVISAFNFPVAVYAWNACIASVCGDTVVWKPSEKAPISAIATQHLFAEVLKENNLPEGLFSLVQGNYEVGEWMTHDKRIPIVSATGSIRMGKIVAQAVGARLGKSILELGGNNGIIISPDADLEMAMRAVVFGAVGTAGQRCTSTRRVFLHQSIYEDFKNRLIGIYQQLSIGHPLEGNLVGPLTDLQAVEQFEKAIAAVKAEGGNLLYGGERLSGEGYESGCYVKPAIAEAKAHFEIVQHETFAPLLYLIKYSELEQAIKWHNDVPQGLSSAIFSNNLREVETFLSATGSDCGIANANIGTSGAEIGGAFGGEKETGGGRESGSDAWKAYMRRQTNTINYGKDLPLAQGIKFDI
ncbi:MAG: aldehyde dehydrogenase family protein [Bacteroidetes bacterium]|nr:aldehyde dehydrogenase family protein [Bacteroidota bacterium]